MDKIVKFSNIIGKEISQVEINRNDPNPNRITFKTTCGEEFYMEHDQNCCEDVYIEDIDNNLIKLIGSKIISAECVTSEDHDLIEISQTIDYENTRHLWTFYKITSDKADRFTIRWFGTSNGYYSEEVDFYQVVMDDV